jgi:hypothetical protein
MANDKSTWRLTLTTPTGDPLFTLRVESEEAEGPKPSLTPPAATASRPQPVPPALQGDGEPRMTEPQKRYLFRLLAEQSVEGKKAEEHLKDYFKVKTLRDVSKSAASQLIEQMVADRKDTRDGAA